MNKVFGKISDFSYFRDEGSRMVVCYGKENVDGTDATWYEVYLPKTQHNSISFEIVKKAIIADINLRTDKKILSGFVWEGINVWLSTENQFNFKAAYDLAIQTQGQSLPVTFKVGEDSEGLPVYHTFTSMEDFTNFYTQAIAFVNQCLVEGWQEKDSIDFDVYQELFPEQVNQEEPVL